MATPASTLNPIPAQSQIAVEVYNEGVLGGGRGLSNPAALGFADAPRPGERVFRVEVRLCFPQVRAWWEGFGRGMAVWYVCGLSYIGMRGGWLKLKLNGAMGTQMPKEPPPYPSRPSTTTIPTYHPPPAGQAPGPWLSSQGGAARVPRWARCAGPPARQH